MMELITMATMAMLYTGLTSTETLWSGELVDPHSEHARSVGLVIPTHSDGPPPPNDLSRRERAAAIQEYQRRRINFRGGQAYQDGRKLGGEEFYHVIDRPELLAEYSPRKTGTVVAGTAMTVAGVGLGLGGAIAIGTQANVVAVGLALAGGVTLFSFGVSILFSGLEPDHPLNTNQRSRVVDEYNQQLRHELGIPGREYGPEAGGYRQSEPQVPTGGISGGAPHNLIGVSVHF